MVIASESVLTTDHEDDTDHNHDDKAHGDQVRLDRDLHPCPGNWPHADFGSGTAPRVGKVVILVLAQPCWPDRRAAPPGK